MTPSSPTVKVDGGQGEGGGQLLRLALSLAAIRGMPVEVHSIRARRKQPGLRPQHLAAVRALAEVCGGRVEGDTPGSDRLAFWPGPLRAGEYRFDIGTAGAATLVLQALLAPLAVAGASRIRITGGTHVPWSPPADYLGEVLFPLLGRMGLSVRMETTRCGLYPKGGGELLLEIEGGAPLRPLTRLRRNEPLRLRGLSAVSQLPRSIAERQRAQALRRLEQAGHAADITIHELDAESPGTFFFLVAESQGPAGGFSSLGRRGVPAERVADEAVEAFLDFTRADAGCDPHLADQLILPMALAVGTSRLTTSRVTMHLLTVIDVVRQLLGCPVQLCGEDGSPGSVTVEGCGASGEPRAASRGDSAGCREPRAEPGAPGADRVASGQRPAVLSDNAAEAQSPSTGSGSRAKSRERGGAEAPVTAPDIPHSAFRIPHSEDAPHPDRPVIRKARAADVPAMQRLLAHFAARGDVLPRTLNEMYQHLRDFFVCEQDGDVVGLVALFVYWEDLAEVRSLAVKEEAAGRGLGRALVRACLQEAADLGVRRLFALTNRPAFFERLGFRVVDKRELPQKIWKDCIRCAKFAACDEVALIRDT